MSTTWTLSNRQRPTPRGGCTKIPAGWSSADHQSESGGLVLYPRLSPPASANCADGLAHAGCQRKRPRRWPAPGATPTAWSLPDAHS
jgi:hypothetical protein